ncbi:MAG TPA: HD-GYP domain-containing protein [Mycobacteriales bacterium]|nr:HD-GYP domain-containing protein [Mycobacteriales bacterium]
MALVAAVCVGVAAAGFRGSVGNLLAFALLYGAATRFATLTSRKMTMSVGFIVALASIAVIGPHGAALVGLAGALNPIDGTTRFAKRLFNGAQFALAAFAAGLAFAFVLGRDPVHLVLSHASLGRVLLAAVAAGLVHYLVNVSLVAGVISLSTGLSLGRVWAGNVSPIVATYLGYGLLGLLMAELYEEIGILAAVLFLAPLLVARAAFANYAQLRATYDSTVRALVQAVETKDYYTRGHSERVSRVTEMIAREWGMREDRVQVIRIAGMLHDVGKLGVPTKILQKQGKLNQLEFEAIKLHPLRGYEMLCEIDFLNEALTGVYHHHERLDGRGYPMGLQDEEIPEFARIIMVADAFDSMTSTRSYRLAKSVDEAVAELRRCEQVQFDPKVVDCLVAAVAKHGWQPHAEPFHGEKVTKEGERIDSPVPVVSTKQGLVAVTPPEPEEARRAEGR